VPYFISTLFMKKLHFAGYSLLFEREYGNLSKLCLNDRFFNSFFDFYPRRIGLESAGYADVYPWIPVTTNWIEVYYHPCHLFKPWIYPLGTLQIGDDFYPAPRDPLQLLTFLYGDSWIEERPRFVAEHLEGVSRCSITDWRRRLTALMQKLNIPENSTILSFE